MHPLTPVNDWEKTRNNNFQLFPTIFKMPLQNVSLGYKGKKEYKVKCLANNHRIINNYGKHSSYYRLKDEPKRNAILEFNVIIQIFKDSVSHNKSKKSEKILGTCSTIDTKSVHYKEI